MNGVNIFLKSVINEVRLYFHNLEKTIRHDVRTKRMAHMVIKQANVSHS